MLDNSFDTEVIAETENFAVWRSDDPEGYFYHIALGLVTLHMSSEEWDELVLLIKSSEA